MAQRCRRRRRAVVARLPNTHPSPWLPSYAIPTLGILRPRPKLSALSKNTLTQNPRRILRTLPAAGPTEPGANPNVGQTVPSPPESQCDIRPCNIVKIMAPAKVVDGNGAG